MCGGTVPTAYCGLALMRRQCVMIVLRLYKARLRPAMLRCRDLRTDALFFLGAAGHVVDRAECRLHVLPTMLM